MPDNLGEFWSFVTLLFGVICAVFAVLDLRSRGKLTKTSLKDWRFEGWTVAAAVLLSIFVILIVGLESILTVIAIGAGLYYFAQLLKKKKAERSAKKEDKE
jgi:hypothetical protein